VLFFYAGFLLVVLASLSGWGQLLAPDWRRAMPGFGERAVLGLLPFTAFGLLASFVTPLGDRSSRAALLIGLALLLLPALRSPRSLLGAHPWRFAAILALLAMFAAVGSVATAFNYDTGLYHLQAISWVEHHRRVFGLANLHVRFGFNSIWLVDAALLDVERPARYGPFLLNAALYLAIVAAVTEALIRREGGARGAPAGRIYGWAMIAILMTNAPYLLFDSLSASPNNDMPAALLSLYAVWLFLRLFEKDGVAHRGPALVALTVVAALDVMAKLSSLPILLLPLMAAVALRRDGLALPKTLRQPGVALLALCVLAWLATGIASSGCLAFPAISSCISGLPWTVPADMTRLTAETVTGWARSPTDGYLVAATGWGWLANWPTTVLAHRPFLLPVSASSAFLLLMIAGAIVIDRARTNGRAARRRAEERACLAALAAMGAGILFWFLLAPDPRFGLGFLLAPIPLAAAWAATRWAPDGVAIQRLCSGWVVTALIVLAAGIYILTNWKPAESRLDTWPSFPQPELHPVALGPAFPALEPKLDQCWDAPLPCTPRGSASPALANGSFLIWRTIESRGPAE
jgi:hypothetical protein